MDLQEKTAISAVGTTSQEGQNGGDDAEPATVPYSYLRIYKYTRSRDVALLIIGVISAIGAGVTQPLMAVVFGNFISKFTDFGSGVNTAQDFREDVNSYTLWFVYLFIAKLLLTYVSGVTFTITALQTSKNIRSEFFRIILQQDISYVDLLGPGAVAVKATTNVNLINAGISSKLGHVIQAIAMIAGSFVIGCMQSWKLMLIITAVGVLPFFVVQGFLGSQEAQIEEDLLGVYSRASNLAEEVLGSIKTVHAFGAKEFLLRKFDQQLVHAKAIGCKKSPGLAAMYGGDMFFSYMPYAVAFWQGVRMYGSGEIDSVGALWIVVFTVLLISTGIARIAPSATAFIQASAAASELFEVLDREPSDSNTGDKLPEVAGGIAFHGVSFSYPSRSGIRVLNDISFECPAGEVTALVGASGSGKSTIIALLERWYEPDAGYITLDGRPITELNMRWLRNQLRLVQQEPVLFNDTIHNNVVQGLTGTQMEFADHETKRRLVTEACKAANAVEFIEKLPEKYDTNVGERATLLSGGQKQRIAIARSIISNPPILLLDEATSALDAQSESIVQDALNKASKSRTTLVIAHKLATVKMADKIIVMGDGEVLEQGTHQQLIGNNGPYATLVKAQGLDVPISKPSAYEALDDCGRYADARNVDSLQEEKLVDLTIAGTHQSAASEGTKQDGTGYHDHEFLQHSLAGIVTTFLGENSHLWREYLVAALMSILGGAVFPALSIILTHLITAFGLSSLADVRTTVDFYAGMLLLIAGVSLITYAVMGWVTNEISQDLTRKYRLEMLSSLLRQDISFFDRPEHAAASLASRLSTDPTGLQELLGINLCFIIIVIVTLISCVVVALAYGWKLGLVVTSTLPLIFGSGVLRLRLEMAFDDQNTAVFANSARFASQAVAAMRTVVSFNIEDAVWREYDETLEALLKRSYGKVSLSMFLYAMAESIQFLVFGLAFWYGGHLLADGEYTTEQFFVVYLAVTFGGDAAGQIFGYTSNISRAVAGGNYILKLRSSTATIADRDDAPDPDHCLGEFSFDKVEFNYPLRPQIPVLQNLELHIKPKTSVAFVGGSGCGKSTTINLLERYYDPTSGTLLVSGVQGDRADAESTRTKLVPLPTLRLSTYRSRLALVSQEPNLYQGTIAENIALGAAALDHSNEAIHESEKHPGTDLAITSTLSVSASASPSEEQTQQSLIIRAAKDANIYDFIASLPEGFQTECGRKGTELSGGRSNGSLIQNTLKGVAGSRTVISVAHRLSTIRDCDQIFVLDGGRVAESGTHQELLAIQDGMYKKLVSCLFFVSTIAVRSAVAGIVTNVFSVDGTGFLH
ncbi:Putative Type 1 protein exporter [Septoria linicola]|uniref:Type 1 protein exporter n=1 Tax=Septoria linicola TaxID=215465 RepID=A0A9Q9EN49_9PEZI|nr:Putative Type 1 protein exporter [Septoria linicola]